MDKNKMIFGIKAEINGVKAAIEEGKEILEKQVKDKRKLKEIKEYYGKDYKTHIKREMASNYLELANWTIDLKLFADKKEEVIEAVENLVREALELLEEIK